MLFFSSNAYAASTQFHGDIGAMVVDSDPIVKLVLLTLFMFSIFSWATIVRKWIVLTRTHQKGELILNTLHESGSMSILKKQVDTVGDCPMAALFIEAEDELKKIKGKTMLSNVENRIRSQITRQQGELNRGMGFLASISNSSPFIGLFGTVWGIMDSFREIGMKGSANLATVAPGISEALVATAAGLFVAIPAVLFYNFYTTQVGHASIQMECFLADFMNFARRGSGNDGGK